MRGLGKIIGYVVYRKKNGTKNWNLILKSKTRKDCDYRIKYREPGFQFRLSRIRKIDGLNHIDHIVEVAG